MVIKFSNWFFQQQDRDDMTGILAKKYLNDKNFPRTTKQFSDIVEYLESSATHAELEILYKAWHEYRILPRVDTIPITQNQTKIKSRR